MTKGSLREQMPVVTALIDDLRSVFGEEYIDSIIRAGIKGQPVFHASENGHTVGTPVVKGVRVGRDARGNSCLIDGPAEPTTHGRGTKFDINERFEYLDWGK